MDFLLHFAAFWGKLSSFSLMVLFANWIYIIYFQNKFFFTFAVIFVYELCFSSLSVGTTIYQGCKQSIQKQNCIKLCSISKNGFCFLQTIQVYCARHHPLNTWICMTGFTKFEHIKKGKYIWQKLPLLTKVYYIQSAYFWAKKGLLPRGLLQIKKR